jgi:mannan endo-1,4-beta-mannosidase
MRFHFPKNWPVLAFAAIFIFSACGKETEQTVTPTPPTTTTPPTTPTTTTSSFNINATLITANPTFEANKLYQFLRDNYGKKVISGVMTLNAFDETTWLKTNTGKEPAILGLDFMHTNRGYNWYNNQEPIQNAKTWWDKNGIPVFVWHWRDPSRVTEEFYTKNTTDHTNGTTFDITKINDPASAEYKAMLSDIDFVAAQFKTLQDQKVPVIFRPLHEAAGGWFWWGAKGGAACKKLYQVMYDRMVNYHGLKNIIWVWTREPNDDAFYPGDEYVDIVGRDIYKDGDHTSQLSEFTALNTKYGNKKMITLSETGSFPDPDNLVKDKAAWSWFMPWYGDYTKNSKYNSLDLWKKAFSSDYVITLDEMPPLKQ